MHKRWDPKWAHQFNNASALRVRGSHHAGEHQKQGSGGAGWPNLSKVGGIHANGTGLAARSGRGSGRGKGVVARSGPGSGQPLGSIQGHPANVDDDQRYIRSEGQRSSPPSTSSSESGGPSVPNDMTPAAFQQSATNGKQLYEWMSEPNSDALTERMIQANKLYPGEKCQSKFTQYEEIANNGWTKNPENSDTRYQVNDIDLEYHAPIHTIVRHFGINSDMKHDNPPGPNVAVMYEQDQTVFNGQEHDRPSFAHLIGSFNPIDGLIVVMQFLDPQQFLEDQIRAESPGINAFDMALRVRDNLPALSRPSDLMFLQYQQLCAKKGTNPRDLRLSILHDVGKPETAQVLDHILKSKGAKKAVKPGKGKYEAPIWNNRLTLNPNTDAFNAVLSTPDTAPLVFLLLQHKEQLGLKRIKAIHISLGSKQAPGDPNEYLGSTLTFEFEDLEKGKWIASGSAGGGDGVASSSKQSEPGSSPEKKKGKFKGKLGKMFGKGKGREGA
ncbi:hypothetical protein PRZ48_008428 [Zasmidium cellare]|uniref:Uncharacterized protein n=1 Tax=Zasmidium cellare TaxID=395010 RepID=A0ABR0EFE4_ZASCE|nr:hypothetical protein PRZ48_008428 [Zasmidium cellare]